MYNMDMEFKVVGGILKFDKKAFILEMLGKESHLRTLLNWKTTGDFAEEHPAVSRTAGDEVLIDFSYISDVVLGQSWGEILGGLKAKYKERVKGRVTCRGTYWGVLTTFEIDLNSEGDKIDYITG